MPFWVNYDALFDKFQSVLQVLLSHLYYTVSFGFFHSLSPFSLTRNVLHMFWFQGLSDFVQEMVSLKAHTRKEVKKKGYVFSDD